MTLLKMLIIITLITSTLAQVNPMLYKWGTYKPQLIHCISERNVQTYNPLTVTFYYFLNNHVDWEKSIKYKISDSSKFSILGDSDDIVYQYLQHDGERFAVHETIDQVNKVHFTNEFYKINPEKIEDWITTAVNSGAMVGDDEYVSLVYSIAIEKLNPDKTDLRKLKVEEENGALKVCQKAIKISIMTSQQVNYIYASLISNNEKVDLNNTPNFGYAVYYQNPILNYNLRSFLYQELKKITSQQESEDAIPFKFGKQVEAEQGNIVFLQYVAKRNEAYKFQLRYTTRETSISSDYFFDYRVLKKLDTINFNNQFQKSFPHSNKNLLPFYSACSKAALVNLLGGFVTSYGNLTCEEQDPACSINKMMLTPTPSRFGFPRPFLWDDGFHNMIVCRWRATLCIQSLSDWFDTISASGWIPREQPRSLEQKAAVPPDFLAQKKSETNPPTFIFNILYLDSLVDKNAEIQQQIRKMWSKIVDWYHFWIKSQGAQESEHNFLYKWWGRNDNSNFGSGMDDWPRSANGFKSKYNIDASAWAWLFAESMHKLSAIYDPQHKDQFRLTADSIKKAIRKQLWDTKDKIFKDVMIDNSFSPHLGYPNLLPLAFGLVDPEENETLDAYVSLMRGELWSNSGLRSLSQDDHHFGKGDNYWTGPVWVQINYLVLRGIHKHYWGHEGMREVYQDLREALMNTVCVNWRETGYFFEHYNQKQDGAGRGYHPFNGWTSTIALIVNEIYD